MRILYVLDYFYPYVGGVPSLFANLTREMVRRGHEVTVITTRPSKVKNFEMHNGIKIIRLGTNRNDFLFKASFYLRSTKKQFDVIHTSTYSAMIPSFVTSLIRKIPAIVSVHEIWSLKEMLEFYKAKGAPYFLEQKILLALPFHKYISPSMHTNMDLRSAGVHNKKIVFIPHGIDEKIFNPSAKRFRKQIRKQIVLQEHDVTGLFIGKPTVFKGVDYLLDAVKIASKKVDVKFIFILSSLYEKERKKFMLKILQDKVLKSKIILLRNSNDHSYVAKVIGASDFVIMPSLSEGFGFVAAEAASVGVPSVVTAGTSLPEVVEKNRHAIHVKPRNSFELANAIIRLATDPALRKKLSKPKVFKNWKETADEYEKVYQSIAKYNEVR